MAKDYTLLAKTIVENVGGDENVISLVHCATRVMSALDITQAKAKDKVLKTDKQRRTYYDYYTSKNWGVMSNYYLCIDAEKFDIEETANMIINAAKKKIK